MADISISLSRVLIAIAAIFAFFLGIDHGIVATNKPNFQPDIKCYTSNSSTSMDTIINFMVWDW
ncbi:hypothetical protein [Providencia hangzhouensis]|uniref:hypothetical protein n=1 Tax=Providencia hangzhouensis TaxID=3031799 RepID=UPI0034DD4F88